jgi:hypothetical protein
MYTDEEKAWWILQNGTVNIVWIYERVGHKLYRRPRLSLDDRDKIPPWIETKRQYVCDLPNNN